MREWIFYLFESLALSMTSYACILLIWHSLNKIDAKLPKIPKPFFLVLTLIYFTINVIFTKRLGPTFTALHQISIDLIIVGAGVFLFSIVMNTLNTHKPNKSSRHAD